jgi:protein involved in polysaccharide export with SLBB domain
VERRDSERVLKNNNATPNENIPENKMNLRIITILVFCLPLFGYGQDQKAYRIGIDDRLQINFWQETATDLNSVVRVREDVKSRCRYRDITAAGLTTNELARK